MATRRQGRQDGVQQEIAREEREASGERAVDQAVSVVEHAADSAIDVMEERLRHMTEERDDMRDQLRQMTDSRDDLQRLVQQYKTSGTATVVGVEGALSVIIGQLQSVAVGGTAATLRQTVSQVGKGLNQEERQQLREYAGRLRGAAEAVEQEAAALLV